MAPRDDSDSIPKAERKGSNAALRLRRAIDAASRDRRADSELRDAARQLVRELRDAEEPPEQMLLTIKRLLAEAGLRPSYSTPNDPATAMGLEASVYRDVIAWSIRLYYDGDGDGSPPE